jgi:putative tricarboxylic transport membrane protein
MNGRDLLAAAILLLIAGAYYWATLQIPSSTLDDGVGPRGFPLALTVALVAVAAAIAVRALMTAPAGARTSGDGAEQEARWPRALGLLALGALYVPVASIVGYPFALFALLVAVPLYERMRWSWRVPAVAAGGALFFYVLFELVLGVRQPEGLLF